jgi:hypothetical protein
MQPRQSDGDEVGGAFDTLFRSQLPRRDKFLSRLFGLFSEEVVRSWCRCAAARYEDLGRPTLLAAGDRYGHTLDFTLRDRESGQTFIAELKCELEYEGYRYLRLRNSAQLLHHGGAAFAKLLAVARNPEAMPVRVGGKVVQVDGAILVWGATTSLGCKAVQADHGFADVLSIEAMLADLRAWDASHWREHVHQLRSWTTELFDALT